MSTRVKIIIASIIAMASVVAAFHFQARRVIAQLVESGTDGRVKVNIGGMNILLHKSSIRLRNVTVRVNEHNSASYKQTTIRSLYIDVNSLWDFYWGGTLEIEALDLRDGELTIFNARQSVKDSIRVSLTLGSVFERLKKDAVRFRIRDMNFANFSLHLLNSGESDSTSIVGMQFSAHELYLSADSMRKMKPVVEVSFPKQTIRFSKGMQIAFDSLFFSTTDNAFQVNKVEVYYEAPGALENVVRIESGKARISNVDLEALLNNGLLVVDSLFLGTTDFQAVWNLPVRNSSQGDGHDFGTLPEFRVNTVVVDRISSNVTVRNEGIENSFRLENATVSIDRLVHKRDSTNVISAEDFTVLVAYYRTFLNNNNTSISFDTVQLQKNQVSLLNFKLNTGGHSKPELTTKAFELRQVDWYSLLLNKELVADEAVVVRPVVNTVIKPNTHDSDLHSKALFRNLRDLLQVQRLTLKDASVHLKIEEQKVDIDLFGASASIRADDMIQSNTAAQALKAVENLSVNRLWARGETLSASMDNLIWQNGSASVENVSYKSQDKVWIQANGVRLGKLDLKGSGGAAGIHNLGWESLRADLTQTGNEQGESTNPPQIPKVALHLLNGRNTTVTFTQSGLKLSSHLKQIKVDHLRLGDTLYMQGVDLTGGQTSVTTPNYQVNLNSFRMGDDMGTLNAITVLQYKPDTAVVQIAEVKYQSSLNEAAQNNMYLREANMSGIVLNYAKKDSLQKMKLELNSTISLENLKYNQNGLSLGTASVTAGPFHFLLERKSEARSEPETEPLRDASRRLRMAMDTVRQKSNVTILPERAAIKAAKSGPNPTHNVTQVSGNSDGIRLALRNVQTGKSDTVSWVKAEVPSITLGDVHIRTGSLSTTIYSGTLQNLFLNSSSLNSLRQIIEDNYPSVVISDLKARIETSEAYIQFDRLDYDPSTRSAAINDLEVRPNQDQKTFFDERGFQTDYIVTRVGAMKVNRIHTQRLVEDSVLQIGSIQITAPQLAISRDKTYPFFSFKTRLLPTNSLQQLGMKIQVDSLLFSNGAIQYTERSRITGEEGTIYFNQLQGRVRNIRNTELKETDSLGIYAQARLLDSARVVLLVKESYHDSLAGFTMATSVSPFHTSILNPVVVPLAAVNFKSGFVDTLLMRAVGQEYLALGSMKFFYRDLKVEFLDKYDTSRHSVKNALLQFAANEFVIRTNNKKRIGTVYYKRDRNRAVFQYWVRMILSGATTSTGAKSNRSQIKRYKRELNLRNVPPIDSQLTEL